MELEGRGGKEAVTFHIVPGSAQLGLSISQLNPFMFGVRTSPRYSLHDPFC